MHDSDSVVAEYEDFQKFYTNELNLNSINIPDARVDLEKIFNINPESNNLRITANANFFLNNYINIFCDELSKYNFIKKIWFDFGSCSEINNIKIGKQHAFLLGKTLREHLSIKCVVLWGRHVFENDEAMSSFWNEFIRASHIEFLIIDNDFFSHSVLLDNNVVFPLAKCALPFKEIWIKHGEDTNTVAKPDFILYLIDKGKNLKKLLIFDIFDESDFQLLMAKDTHAQHNLNQLQEALKKNFSIISFEFDWEHREMTQKSKNFINFKNICLKRNKLIASFPEFQSLIINTYSEFYDAMSLLPEMLSLAELALIKATREIDMDCKKLPLNILEFLSIVGPMLRAISHKKFQKYNDLLKISLNPSEKTLQETDKACDQYYYISQNILKAECEIQKREIMKLRGQVSVRHCNSSMMFGNSSSGQEFLAAVTPTPQNPTVDLLRKKQLG